MKKLIGILLLTSLFWPFLNSAKAQGTVQMKDTYFHRFYYRSIIMGTSSVGKYNLDFINGKEASALGFILDFPNGLIKNEKVSQTAGLFFYGFQD